MTRAGELARKSVIYVSRAEDIGCWGVSRRQTASAGGRIRSRPRVILVHGGIARLFTYSEVWVVQVRVQGKPLAGWSSHSSDDAEGHHFPPWRCC